MRVLDSSVRRGTSALLFTGLLIGGLMINGQNETLSYWLLGISALPLIHALGFGRISR
jgi:hypothetical protein